MGVDELNAEGFESTGHIGLAVMFIVVNRAMIGVELLWDPKAFDVTLEYPKDICCVLGR